MLKKTLSSLRRRTRGVALVITLAIVVILTVVIVAFFSQAMSNRQVESSRAHQSEVDTLGRAACDYVVGQFLQEITVNSNAVTGASGPSSGKVYLPKADANNKYAVPQRFVGAGITGTNFFNLIRQSVNGADANASTDAADNTSKPSANGRTVNAARWNLPQLIPAPSGTGGSSPGFTDPGQLPCWVYVNNVNAGGTGVGPGAKSANTVGRFAYNVYNTGGLLDVNAAGYPSVIANSTSGAAACLKGSLAGADLTQLPGVAQADVDNLLNFRNPDIKSKSYDATTFQDWIAACVGSGFLSPNVTSAATGTAFNNNVFTSRQDLLRYVASQNTNLTGALPYLTTFSRSVNAPSWVPANPAGQTSSIDYAGQSEVAAAPNRDLANVRFGAAGTITHFNDDGTTTTFTVQAGDSLFQRRFSLARLGWIAHTGPAKTAYKDAILSCFGLHWDSGTVPHRWVYVGSPGGQSPPYADNASTPVVIETLNQVATEGREPNFFETLKAAILAGSLGDGPGPTLPGEMSGGQQGPVADVDALYNGANDMHILQIGANIIDQYGGPASAPTNFPTAILGLNTLSAEATSSNNNQLVPTQPGQQMVYGIKNVPYLASISEIFGFDASSTKNANGTTTAIVGCWLQPAIWNPHAADGTRAVAVTGPTEFRVSAAGQAQIDVSVHDITVSQPGPTVQTYKSADCPIPYGRGAHTATETSADSEIVFSTTTAANARGQVLPLDKNNTSSHLPVDELGANWLGTAPTNSLPVGVRIATMANNPITFPWDPRPGSKQSNGQPWNPNDTYHAAAAIIKSNDPASHVAYPDGTSLTLTLEYHDNGVWYPYTAIANFARGESTFVNFKKGGTYYNLPFIQDDGGPNYFVSMTTNTASPSYRQTYFAANTLAHLDPRVDRFSTPDFNTNTGSNNTGLGGEDWITNSLRARNSYGFVPWTTGEAPPPKGLFSYPAGINPVSASNVGIPLTPIFQNLYQNSATTYCDQDGVTRPADGANANAASAGDPSLAGTGAIYLNTYVKSAQREIVLNRPFQSIGELGYASRDLPFASLNFWSPLSADLALLDVFSLQDVPPVTAGAVNLNVAPAPVVAALLANARKTDGVSNLAPAYIAPADAQTLATAWTGRTTPPLKNLNRADLAPALAATLRAATAFVADVPYKNYEEAPLRAVVTPADTRTWNLLIDVVAQVGRFPANAGANPAAAQFIVAGEKHYWLSVAIDRYTGKIVDRQLEPVNE